MKNADTTEPQRVAVQNENVIRMPFGLLGFESVKHYVLLSNPEEAPFLWLEMVGDMKKAFLVVAPTVAVPAYAPRLSDEDVAFLGLKKPEDALVFNIVTLRGPGQATVNLKGPIVLNRHTLVGKQVVPQNAADYAVRHPLPIEG